MVNLKENRPDSTGLARVDLSTMTAPPGKRIGEAYADDLIAKMMQQIAKHKADREKEDHAPLTQMPGLRLLSARARDNFFFFQTNIIKKKKILLINLKFKPLEELVL